jgi:hypothetical protein
LKRLKERTETLREKLIKKHHLEDFQIGQHEYKCKHCGKCYEKSTSLGGHISKSHKRLNFSKEEGEKIKEKEIFREITRLEAN